MNELVSTSRGGRSELSEEPRPMKSDCLHEGPGANRRATLPLLPLSITKNFGTQMSHSASPSSSSRKPKKQKQNVKKIKKSVLGRQTVELLDRTALEYVRAQLLMFCCTSPECADRSCVRSRRMTSKPSRIYRYRI